MFGFKKWSHFPSNHIYVISSLQVFKFLTLYCLMLIILTVDTANLLSELILYSFLETQSTLNLFIFTFCSPCRFKDYNWLFWKCSKHKFMTLLEVGGIRIHTPINIHFSVYLFSFVRLCRDTNNSLRQFPRPPASFLGNTKNIKLKELPRCSIPRPLIA